MIRSIYTGSGGRAKGDQVRCLADRGTCEFVLTTLPVALWASDPAPVVFGREKCFPPRQ